MHRLGFESRESSHFKTVKSFLKRLGVFPVKHRSALERQYITSIFYVFKVKLVCIKKMQNTKNHSGWKGVCWVSLAVRRTLFQSQTGIRKFLYQSEKRYEAYQSEVTIGGNMNTVGVKPQIKIRCHSEFSVIEP